ncbi:MAG TPA: pyridoxal-dependent decarboxylase, partial [Terriglobales bacterium]|nr:pyridoxal-dependent decarboxylase [Terriglobales bacterium]
LKTSGRPSAQRRAINRMNFQLDHSSRQRLGYKLIDLINEYFDSLSDRPVQLPLEERTFGQLRDVMPEIGEEANAVLDEMAHELINKGFHVPAANYFGLMNPTPTYMAVLAEAFVAAINPQLASLARSQLASKIEAETVRWIGERIWGANGQKPKFDGTFTSGGNEANFSALAMALATHHPCALDDGFAGCGDRPVLYASAESHHSLDKSAGLLGIGRKALRRIPVNARLQLDVALLDRQIQADVIAGFKPFAVVGTAGTTNSGAVDDLNALANICERYGLWFHVDGAYGAAATFSDKHRNLVAGIERADSVTIDPHKWLAMPFAAGVVLTRRAEMLQKTFGVATPYMPKVAGATIIDNFKVSAQWSRRMNSLKLWLTLRVHGRQAYEQLIDEQLRLARKFADWIKQSEHFELVHEPQLTIVNFRPRGIADSDAAAANATIVDEITRDGRRWLSQTVAGGKDVIRMMVISYLTSEKQLQELQEALTAAALKTARVRQRANV